jgi:predicted dienelactone hydrolase
MSWRSDLVAFIASGVVFVACAANQASPPSSAVATPASSAISSVPDLTSPTASGLTIVGPGPYRVGTKTITITDTIRGRSLQVDVWFPIRDDVEGKPFAYSLLAGVQFPSVHAVGASPADIAPSGPFPLLVHSHGSAGLRYISSFYTEELASYGYIVAAPDHAGDTTIDRLANAGTELNVTAWNRPNDVKAVIDAMINRASPEAGAFAVSVNADRIAVSGHSMGGFTALAMATGFANDQGVFAPDLRVDAVIAMAPATGGSFGSLLSDEDLAALTIPTMLIVGQDDKVTPVASHVTRPWALAQAKPFYRVELVAAEHQSFTDVCDYQKFLAIDVKVEAIEDEGCAATDMPIQRAQGLTNTFAVHFLESIFRGGPPIDPTTITVPDDVILLVK